MKIPKLMASNSRKVEEELSATDSGESNETSKRSTKFAKVTKVKVLDLH